LKCQWPPRHPCRRLSSQRHAALSFVVVCCQCCQAVCGVIWDIVAVAIIVVVVVVVVFVVVWPGTWEGFRSATSQHFHLRDEFAAAWQSPTRGGGPGGVLPGTHMGARYQLTVEAMGWAGRNNYEDLYACRRARIVGGWLLRVLWGRSFFPPQRHNACCLCPHPLIHPSLAAYRSQCMLPYGVRFTAWQLSGLVGALFLLFCVCSLPLFQIAECVRYARPSVHLQPLARLLVPKPLDLSASDSSWRRVALFQVGGVR
jgi:hypothetical protein